MVNASARLAGGGECGLWAEIGIGTDELHAGGPMGADGLTTYRWVVVRAGTCGGDGVCRCETGRSR